MPDYGYGGNPSSPPSVPSSVGHAPGLTFSDTASSSSGPTRTTAVERFVHLIEKFEKLEDASEPVLLVL